MRYPSLPFVLVFAALLGATGVAAEEGKGPWRSRCEETRGKVIGGCFIYQDLVLREGGQRVLQFAAGYTESTPDPIALISLPLGISLPPGVILKVDDGKATSVMVERCEPTGCRAGLKLDASLMRALRTGRQLNVSFRDAERKPIEVSLSLGGFSAGLDALKAKSPTP